MPTIPSDNDFVYIGGITSTSLHALSTSEEQLGGWDEAVDYYRRSIDADPLAEGIYRHLMVCYQKLGRRAEGLETYNQCRKTLRLVLGVEPSVETKAIYEELSRAQ